MARIVSFEGCVGAGKTTLVNFLSKELGLGKILEHDYHNPFVDDFYAGADIKFETELSFLLQHYSLLKNARSKDGLILSDFSIEKDLVFALLNLTRYEFNVFKGVYDFAVGAVGTQELVVYLDMPSEVLINRIRQRGRLHEVKADPAYFKDYSDRLRLHFTKASPSKVLIVNGHDLELSPVNAQVKKIVKKIQETTGSID